MTANNSEHVEKNLNLIIHIGFHKTGTSSLQWFCEHNPERLASHGILYPEAGRVTLETKSVDTAQAGHRKFQVVLSAPESQGAAELLGAIRAEAKAKGCSTILISSETFSAIRLRLSDTCIDELGKHFATVRVVAYLRRQDEWAGSFYREVLCWPDQKLVKTYEHYCRGELAPWLAYQDRLARWEKVFGRQAMLVRSYNDRQNADIVADFFNTIGFDMDVSGQPSANNPSLPWHLVDDMIALNATGLDKYAKSDVTRRMFRMLAETRETRLAEPMVSETLENARPLYMAANAALAETYAMPPSPVFCFEKTPDSWGKPLAEPALPADFFTNALEQLRTEGRFRKDAVTLRNDGSWGMSVLTNEGLVQTAAFIEYHLAVGASQIIVFLDNPDDDVQNHIADPRVDFVRCDEAFWRANLGRLPESNFEKLQTVHLIGRQRLVQDFGLDWATNIDADELIWSAKGSKISDVLAELGHRANLVQLHVREAVFVEEPDSDIFAAGTFKVLRRTEALHAAHGTWIERLFVRFARHVTVHSGRMVWFFRYVARYVGLGRLRQPWRMDEIAIPRWSGKDEALYREAMPDMVEVSKAGFLGHTQGRVFTRADLKISELTSHAVKSVETPIVGRGTGDRMFLLHFDAVDYDAWYLKWYRRIYGNARVFRISDSRQQQQDMFAEAYKNGQTEALFKSLFFIPKQYLDRMFRQNLIVRLDVPHVRGLVAKWRERVKSTKP